MDENPADAPKPEKKTERRRSGGDSSSGGPPRFRIATGFEGRRNPQPDQGSRSRPSSCDLFGIDFGEETTRIASIYSGVPYLVFPAGISTTLSYGVQTQSWESRGQTIEVNMLRNRLRLDKEAEVQGRVVCADKLLSEFFSSIAVTLREWSGGASPRVVVTVPSVYGSEQRKSLVSAIRAARITVLGLINDYAAPVLTYSHRRPASWNNILVLTLGATSLSAAVMKSESRSIITKAADSVGDFSGHQLMLDLMSLVNNGDVSDTTSAIETLHAFDERNVLSYQPRDGVTIERADLVEFLSDQLSCIGTLMRSVIDSSLIPLSAIDRVLINGKLATSHLVRSIIAAYVPGKNVVILNSERASCFGAVLHASELARSEDISTVTDVLTKSLQVRCGPSLTELLAGGTTLPTAVKISVNSSDTPSVVQSMTQSSIAEDCVAEIPYTSMSNVPSQEDYELLVVLTRDGRVDRCELS